jgi:undecaprenyl-diphosphatase
VKIVPLIAAALVVAALSLRWRRLPAHVRGAGLVAVLALAVYGAGVVHPPSLEAGMRQLGGSLGSYAYPFVGVMAFLETGAGVGLIAPGELAVIIGGVTAGQGHTDIAVMIAVVWGCALTGDITSYLLGRRLGSDFVRRHGPKLRLTTARIEQVERFFAQHGGKTIIIGRFIGLVRSLAPFTAGACAGGAGGGNRLQAGGTRVRIPGRLE